MKKKRITHLDLSEISYVDRPAQTHALATIRKNEEACLPGTTTTISAAKAALARFYAEDDKPKENPDMTNELESLVSKRMEANGESHAVAMTRVFEQRPELYEAEQRRAAVAKADDSDLDAELRRLVEKRMANGEPEYASYAAVLKTPEGLAAYQLAEQRRAAKFTTVIQ